MTTRHLASPRPAKYRERQSEKIAAPNKSLWESSGQIGDRLTEQHTTCPVTEPLSSRIRNRAASGL